MDEHEAIAAFERLGLTNYEAKVFIALHQIGTGSAREVAKVSDVPRPQVYSTAESLEERGLLDVQQSDPIRYRPVSIDEARSRLQNRFERTQNLAFEYLEDVTNAGIENERQEDIWTVSGRETITDRIVHLIGIAERDVLFAVDTADFVDTQLVDAIRDAAEAGCTVTVMSHDRAVTTRFKSVPGVAVADGIEAPAHDDPAGRLLIIDEEIILLSAFGEETVGERSETAIWSGETEFARVLIRLIQRKL